MRLLLISFCLLLLSCSTDKVVDVTELMSPFGINSSLPRLYTDNSGVVFMSWVETNNDTTSLFYSSFFENKWTKPLLINKSDSLFVNWADFPSIIAQDGEVQAAHWLKKIKGGTYAYNVEIVTAKGNWENVVSPHKDNTATEHGFVSMVTVSDSTFLSVWLDGRNTTGHEDNVGSKNTSGLINAMSLRAAVLDFDLNLINEFEIDNSVCDCCGTATTETEHGFITAYRNRNEEEIRDIYVSKFINGNWSEPIAVSNDGWKISGCPVNGPAIDSKDKMVAVSWFTGANEVENVKLAISLDDGSTFSNPIIIDNGNPLGRVDLEIFNDQIILVSWLEQDLEDRSKASFMAKAISSDGTVLDEYNISIMSSSRKSGFPQITSYDNSIIAAWTDLKDGIYSTVKTAILEL